jgi:hypothetical protein
MTRIVSDRMSVCVCNTVSSITTALQGGGMFFTRMAMIATLILEASNGENKVWGSSDGYLLVFWLRHMSFAIRMIVALVDELSLELPDIPHFRVHGNKVTGFLIHD